MPSVSPSVSIVYSDVDTSAALRKYLEWHGNVVSWFGSAEDALDTMTRSPADVLVLDLLLPDMDGCTFLKILGSSLLDLMPPVVLLTDFIDSRLTARARRMGVSSIFVKGRSSLEEIHKAVGRAIEAGPAALNVIGTRPPFRAAVRE